MITAVGARLTAMDARPTAMDARHWAPSILLEGLNWHLLRPVQGDRRGRFLNTFDLTESARQRTFWNRAPRGCEPSSKVPLALSPEWHVHERFKPLHDDGKPLWEFKEHGH